MPRKRPASLRPELRQPPLDVSASLGHRGRLTSATLHPAGHVVLAGGEDAGVHTYASDTGHEIAPPSKGHHGAVHCLRFAPDGVTFTSGADDATVRLWRSKYIGSS